MSDNNTQLDSMTPDIKDSQIDMQSESAKPNIDLMTRIDAGQRIGTPNVTMPQQKKPDFTPPTLKTEGS